MARRIGNLRNQLFVLSVMLYVNFDGWVCAQGLGKDGSGMKEPVQAQGVDRRAGLGSQQKKVDAEFEVQPGDTYRTLLHKKALARFRDMSDNN